MGLIYFQVHIPNHGQINTLYCPIEQHDLND